MRNVEFSHVFSISESFQLSSDKPVLYFLVVLKDALVHNSRGVSDTRLSCEAQTAPLPPVLWYL